MRDRHGLAGSKFLLMKIICKSLCIYFCTYVHMYLWHISGPVRQVSFFILMQFIYFMEIAGKLHQSINILGIRSQDTFMQGCSCHSFTKCYKEMFSSYVRYMISKFWSCVVLIKYSDSIVSVFDRESQNIFVQFMYEI